MKWEKVKLKKLVETYGGVIQTGPFGSQLHEADYSDEGTPVVMPKDIIDGVIDESSIARVEGAAYQSVKRHALKVGDIVLPRRGNFAKRALVTEREKDWICGTGCLKINISPKALLPEYFYHLLGQSSVVEYIESRAVGSTMLNLSASIVADFEFPIPPPEIQRQIATILGRYDTLLANYQQQITTLEALAQEIYREWFVRGRCPGAIIPPGADLPEGWERTRLGKLCAVIQRGITPAYAESGEYLCLNQRCIRNNAVEYATGRMQEKDPGRKLVQFGDMLINSTGEGTLGRTAQVYTKLTVPVTVDSHVTIARPTADVSTEFFGFLVTSLEDYFTSRALGSTGQTELSREAIAEASVIRPSSDAMTRFSQIVAPIKAKIESLQAQSALLRETRDALLPRLLSGQLSPSTLPTTVPA